MMQDIYQRLGPLSFICTAQPGIIAWLMNIRPWTQGWVRVCRIEVGYLLLCAQK